MQQTNCLNMCEILPFLQKRKKISDVLKDACNMALYDTCERLYIGSYFCGKYFLQQSDATLIEVFNVCKDEKMKVTLVIPTFSEGDLDVGKKRIEEVLRLGEGCIDEITVNDYGMLLYICEQYRQAVNLGRLFMKDYRDPRYEEYFTIPWKTKAFTEYIKQVIDKYTITSCEFDITHKHMDFTDVKTGCTIGLHVPYCYQTMGRICEFASILKDVEKKFRANDMCDGSCAENRINYFIDDNHLEYVRYGRAVYFKHPGYEWEGMTHYRLIYFSIDMK